MAEPTIVRNPDADPYAPKAAARPVAEGQSELDQFANRLRQLGATPEEVRLVVDTWDELDPEDSTDPDAWTRARRSALAHADDATLRAHIDAARAEYEHDTTTEDEAAERDAGRADERAKAQAAERIGDSVAALRSWVGDDVARARAVLALETAPDGENRKTLVEPLTALVDAQPTSGPTAAAKPAAGTTTPQPPSGAPAGPPAPAGGSPGPTSLGL